MSLMSAARWFKVCLLRMGAGALMAASCWPTPLMAVEEQPEALTILATPTVEVPATTPDLNALQAELDRLHAESMTCYRSADAPYGDPCMAPDAGCCDNDCPRAYAWADGLVLTRDNDSPNRPLVLDVNANEVVLTTCDLDFVWSGGLRSGYGHRLGDCWGAELVYLG